VTSLYPVLRWMNAALCVLVVGAAVYAYGAAFPTKVPRTRQSSRFWGFYCRMTDTEFRAAFRVPRPLFDAVVRRLRSKLEWRWRHYIASLLISLFASANLSAFALPCGATNRGRVPHERVTAEDKVAAMFKRLASGTCFREIGYEFNMSTAWAQRSHQRTAAAFVKEFGGEVRLPTHAEARASARQYMDRFGVHYCCGAVDGSHIRFRCGASIYAARRLSVSCGCSIAVT
jgi:hypothetical protein